MRLELLAFVLLAAAFALFSACDGGGTEAPEPGSIVGEVRVEGSPLADVTVELSGAVSRSTTTDESGDFRFDELEPGTYEIRVSGFPDEVEVPDTDATVSLEAGATATVEFTGNYVRTARIDGTVTADGEPVEGATARLSGTESRETTTGADGGFSFAELRAGSYTVEISGVGSNVVLDDPARSVELGAGDHASLAFQGTVHVAARVEVPYIERPGTSLRMNLGQIQGEVDVIALVEPGTETVTRVRAYLRGLQVGSVSFPEGLTTERKVEVRVNTAAFDPDTGEPTFENGEAVVRAEIDTRESGTAAASGTLDVTLDNRNQLAGVSAADVGEGVVSGGRRWHGNRDLTFEVVPVLFNPDRTVGAIALVANGDPSANGGSSLDFGSGPGEPHRVEGPPFLFTAAAADNRGLVEDRPDGAGHTIRVDAVFDGDGVDVTSDFVPGRTQPLEGFYADFVAPVIPSGAALSVGGRAVTGGEWFSRGDFGVTSLTEGGSGGTATVFEVDVAGESEPITGAESVDDLAENRNSAYSVRLVEVEDALSNRTDAADLPGASPSFGVDRTRLNVSDVLPGSPLVLNPDDEGGDGITDNRLAFTAEDPVLPSGQTASGYATATAEARTPGGTPLDLTPSISPNAAGPNTIDMSSMGENDWTIEVTATDNATPANETIFSYSVIVDKTSPSVSLVNPPPSNVTSSGTVTFTIQGTAADTNGLHSVFVRVRDADSASGSANDSCELSDSVVPSGTGPGQVDPAQIEVTESADDFSVNITAHDPGGGQSDLCFFIEAADAAKDRHGNPEANRSNTSSRTVVTWN